MMSNDFKINMFKKELKLIRGKCEREYATELLMLVPDYFFTVPSTSTGKHHPKFTHGEGGLVRHTKAAIGIAKSLFELYKFDNYERDIIIISLMFHDCIKYGKVQQDHMVFEHPLLAAEFIIKNSDTSHFVTAITVSNAICSHMGKWNKREMYKDEWNTTDNTTNTEDLPLPTTEIQKFVHMCDYLASRKQIEYTFN